ncbi:MAG: dihydropteroate synthase [Finegoldia sp.]|nr:dihydropteroate synthase [Finegoldia sp.]
MIKFSYKDKEIRSGGETILCGIVNVTPDSFSDGGKWYGKEKAVNRALELIDRGAKMLDIGGESTRPGSTRVANEEEIARVVPVIEELKKRTDVAISVDTWKADVAEEAIKAGADIINDITGFLGDEKMAEVVADSDAGAILMYNPVIQRPDHEGSKIFPSFEGKNAFTDVEREKMNAMEITDAMEFYLRRSLEVAHKAGVKDERIMLDPGIGFGLTKRENLILLRNCVKVFHDMGYLAFIGVSRKRFIVNILNDLGFNMDTETEEGRENREKGSAVLTAIAAYQGAEVLRVHSIPDHLIARTIADGVRLAESQEDLNFGSYKNK